MKSELENVYSVLTNTGKERSNYRLEVGHLTDELNHAKELKASPLEIEKLENKIQAAKAKQREYESTQYAKVMEGLDKLQNAAILKHKEFSKKSDLPSAVATISAMGDNLDEDTFDTIVTPFLLDQTSLKILRGALVQSGAKVGIPQIDNVVYNEQAAFGRVRKLAQNAMNGGNLNSVSAQLAEIVARDGIVVEPTCDPDGVVDATRKAAGLKSAR